MPTTELSSIPWISIAVFLPLLGAAVLMLVPGEHKQVHRHIAMAFMTMTLVACIPLVAGFDASNGNYQLTAASEQVPWIAAIGASYHLGVDGISLWLILLTAFLGPIVVLASYRYIDTRVKEFHIAVLVLQTAMLGAFVALDVLLFYIFWELMLVPMYLLIGFWGSKDRIYAAVKLFLYTMVGSLLMLVAILYVYAQGGAESFALDHMIQTAQGLGAVEQRWLFAAFALAFLIKVPVFPLHTWLPDAHVQAPTAGSVILAGILLKMGTYGLIRFGMPMFPNAVVEAAPFLAALSVIGIVYGAVIAYVQSDVKKLIAYSSVSHLGFVVLGLAALTTQSATGAVFQGLAHGITTSGLFLCIGLLYERRHTREMDAFGGLAKVMPIFTVFFVIVAMGSAGVPGLAGFIGEFLILIGSAQSTVLSFGPIRILGGLDFGPEVFAMVFVVIATSGVIIGALYLLHMLQKVMFGPIRHEENRGLKDLSGREIAYLIPIVLMTLFMGVRPQVFMEAIEPAVERTLTSIEMGATGAPAEAIRASRHVENNWRHFVRESAEEPWSVQAEHKDDAAH